jgi:hypothetical protein
VTRSDGASETTSDGEETRPDPPGRLAGVRAMLPWDVRLQVRYGFYTVYAVITAFYALAFQFLPPALVEPALVLVVVTDPGVLGF